MYEKMKVFTPRNTRGSQISDTIQGIQRIKTQRTSLQVGFQGNHSISHPTSFFIPFPLLPLPLFMCSEPNHPVCTSTMLLGHSARRGLVSLLTYSKLASLPILVMLWVLESRFCFPRFCFKVRF